MSSIATSPLQPPPESRRRPGFVNASLGIHACAGAAALALPGAEIWALGAVALNHAVLACAGLWPRSVMLGPNIRRLPPSPAAPRLCLTFDDGPDPEVTPRVLQLLHAAGARATFFCIAERAAQHPQLVREIMALGHCVQNHSHSHRHHFSLLGRRGFEREIGAAQDRLTQLAGTRPHCFRAPAGLRNPLLDPVLYRLDLHLVSWTRRGFDTRANNAAAVLQRLALDLADGDILLLHDGHACRTPAGVPVVLEVLPQLLARCRALGLNTVTLSEAVPRRHDEE